MTSQVPAGGNIVPGPGGSGSGADSNSDFVTFSDESSTLPNSRRLVNGTNTTVDTSTPGQIKVNASGGGGGVSNPLTSDLDAGNFNIKNGLEVDAVALGLLDGISSNYQYLIAIAESPGEPTAFDVYDPGNTSVQLAFAADTGINDGNLVKWKAGASNGGYIQDTGISAASINPTVHFAELTLSPTDIENIFSTPFQMVAAPGAGKYIIPLTTSYKYTFNTSHPASGSGAINLYYENKANAAGIIDGGSGIVPTNTINNPASTMGWTAYGQSLSLANPSNCENKPLVAQCSSGAYGPGGDSTVTMRVWYMIAGP